MKKIIGILRPFDIQQIFYVYEDGNKIQVIKTSIDNLPKDVILLAKKYQINQIDLSGSQYYAKGIIKKIQEEEIKKYSSNELIINCI